MSEGEAPVLREVKANHLFDAVLEGFDGHLGVFVVFPHEGKRSLKLHRLLAGRRTSNDREEGIEVLKPCIVVPFSRCLRHPCFHHPS